MDFDSKEILESFALEVAEHIQFANECILLMEEERDEEAVNGLFRVLHTVKGNSMMLGFDRLGKLAHVAEGLVAKLRSKAMVPSKQIIDLMFSVLDTIEAMAHAALHERSEPDGVDALINILASVAEGTLSPQNVRLEVSLPTAPQATLDSGAALPHLPDLKNSGMVIPSSESAAGGTSVASTKQELVNPAPAVQAAASQELGRPLSMLIVEDEFISRKMLTALLQPYGSCDVAVDGVEALAAFSQSIDSVPYDFVFLDIMMPKMDGFEATKQMRALEMHKAMQVLKERRSGKTIFNKHDTVIVITSSLDDPEHYFNACYRCGANTYLVKPISREAIDSLMTKYSSMLQ